MLKLQLEAMLLMKILAAYDGSPHSDAAIDSLERAGLPRTGEALIACVADEGWPPVQGGASGQHAEGFASSWAERLHEAEVLAQKAGARFQKLFPGWTTTPEALWGSTAKALLKTVDWWKPDMLVVGSHGRSPVASLMMGSVSLSLIHHAPCQIRVVRLAGPPHTGPIRLLVATDGSSWGHAALEAAARRTWPEGTEVRVLGIVETMVPPPPQMVPGLESQTFATEPAFQLLWDSDERERGRLRRVVEEASGRLELTGLKANPIVRDGDPRTEIVAEAKQFGADTIFVGARGLGTLDRLLLGSVSTAVVTHAHCSVEVVRSVA